MQGNTISIQRHFRMLFDFTGRESRASFWPYAGSVFGISMVLSTLAMVPAIYAIMRPMRDFEDFIPDLKPTFWMMGFVFIVAVFLYAAAVARRLHDTGRSGWWGMMPIPFSTFSLAAMPQVLDPSIGGNGERLFFAIFYSNMLHIVACIALITLLSTRSTKGPNHFGPVP